MSGQPEGAASLAVGPGKPVRRAHPLHPLPGFALDCSAGVASSLSPRSAGKSLCTATLSMPDQRHDHAGAAELCAEERLGLAWLFLWRKLIKACKGQIHAEKHNDF